MDHAGRRRDLAGDMRVFILFQDCVEHRVGNLVAYLVGMPFRYGFRSEKVFCHNLFFLSD